MKEYKQTIPEIKLKKEKTDFKKVKISDSKEAHLYIKEFYSDDISIYESMFLLLLNRANNTIGYAKISQGGTVGTVVDNKLIAKYCIEGLASSCILAHNHPSGNTNPSEADIRVTKKVKEVLSLIDVEILDHLILSEDNYYSLKDNGDF